MNTKFQITKAIIELGRVRGIDGMETPTTMLQWVPVSITSDTLSRALRRHSITGYMGVKRTYRTINGKRLAFYYISKTYKGLDHAN